MLANALRAHFAELGIVAAQGISKIIELVRVAEDESDARLPPLARVALRAFAAQIEVLQLQIRKLEKQIVAWCRSDGQPAARHHPASVRSRNGDRRDGDRPIVFSFGPAVCRLAGPGAAAKLERWQRAPRRHLQAGGSLYPPTARHRRSCGHSLRPRQKRRRSPMDQQPARPQADADHRGRAR
jgi:hypothetical protein